jgi:glycosyltransferase involved in cell wall biosynthesis
MESSVKVLITSPSLNAHENVSGISSLVASIIARGQCEFVHFELGSKDGQRKRLKWCVQQVMLYLRMAHACFYQKIDIVHLNVGLEVMGIIRDFLLMLVAKGLFRKKLLLHLHGGYYLMNEPRDRLLAAILLSLLNSADLILVLSEREKSILTARYGPRNFQVLPNAVEHQEPKSRAKKAAKVPLKLVFVGRITHTKGIFIIGDAFRYLQPYFDQFTFDIYGAGPDLEDFVAQLSAYPQLQYTYRGVVKEAQKWRTLHEADVLLLPSIHSEGMPMAILESMAARCLVISTNDASITTVIIDGENGLIVPKADPRALAASIIDVLSGRVDRHRLAANAARHVASQYSMGQYALNLQQAYKELKITSRPVYGHLAVEVPAQPLA